MRAGKRYTSFNSNGDMNGTIKIIKALEESVVLIDRVTETVTLEIKIQVGRFLGALLPL